MPYKMSFISPYNEYKNERPQYKTEQRIKNTSHGAGDLTLQCKHPPGERTQGKKKSLNIT